MKKLLAFLLLLASPAFAAGNTPISGLPTASALSGGEAVPIVQSGATVQTTTGAIGALGGGGGGGSPPGGNNTNVQYNNAGAFAGDQNFTYSTPGVVSVGNNSHSTGMINLSGSSSGIVTIQPQNSGGIYNFNLPNAAGSSGQVLLSGGGGTSPMTWGSVPVAGGGTGVSSLTFGTLYKGNGTSPVIPSALTDNGTIVKSSESFDVTSNSFVIELNNDGATGTTLNKLVKVSSGGNAILAATSDTSGIIGVVTGGAGTSGTAQISTNGTAMCVFDGTATAGHYVGISSTTAGDCTDTGSSLPTSGESLGRITAGGTGAGTYTMIVNPGSTYISNNSTGASGNVQTSNGSGGFNNFALPIAVSQGGLGLTSVGTSGTYLQSNGSGYVFAAGTVATGSGLPGGAATQLQYNASGGNFGGLTSFYVQAYGATCGGTVLNGSVTVSGSNVSSPNYTFTSADVGKTISLSNWLVNSHSTVVNNGFQSTIASVSAGHAVLAAPPGAGYNSARFYMSDDTTAIQNAINAAYALGTQGAFYGGGEIIFPPTMCASGQLTFYPNQKFSGSGPSSIVMLKNGANSDLFKSYNYDTDAASGAEGGNGDNIFSDLQLDGNRGANTALNCGGLTSAHGDGIRLYGYETTTSNLLINYFPCDGIETMWYGSGGNPVNDNGTAGWDGMENNINLVKAFYNGGYGIVFAGPHDSRSAHITLAQNGLGGLELTGNGNQFETITDFHGYDEGNDIVELNEGVFVNNFSAEGGILLEPFGASGDGPSFYFENGNTGTLTLGNLANQGNCSQGPYKIQMTDFSAGTIVNYGACGFFDHWIGGSIGTISATGLGYYNPTFAYGVLNLPNQLGNSTVGGTAGFNNQTPLSFISGSSGAATLQQSNAGNFYITNGGNAQTATYVGGVYTNGGIQGFMMNPTGQVGIGTSTSIVAGTTLGVSGDIDVQASHYINFGGVDGLGGYGLRDSGGTMQFKSNGGSWTNINSVVYPAATDIIVSTGSSGIPTGIAPVNGRCVVASGGAWGAGSCAGLTSITMGTSAAAASPQIATDPTTGFYSAGAGLVDVAVSGVKMIEWSSVGETLQHALNVIGKITYGGPVNVHTAVITSGSTYSISSASDYFICVDKTIGSATNVILPASPIQGDLYIVKDCKGDAGTNNITITPTGAQIDGASTALISTNYGVEGFVFNGSTAGWSIE